MVDDALRVRIVLQFEVDAALLQRLAINHRCLFVAAAARSHLEHNCPGRNRPHDRKYNESDAHQNYGQAEQRQRIPEDPEALLLHLTVVPSSSAISDRRELYEII